MATERVTLSRPLDGKEGLKRFMGVRAADCNSWPTAWLDLNEGSLRPAGRKRERETPVQEDSVPCPAYSDESGRNLTLCDQSLDLYTSHISNREMRPVFRSCGRALGLALAPGVPLLRYRTSPRAFRFWRPFWFPKTNGWMILQTRWMSPSSWS